MLYNSIIKKFKNRQNEAMVKEIIAAVASSEHRLERSTRDLSRVIKYSTP